MGKRVLIIGDSIIDKSVNLQALGLSLESPTLKTSFMHESRHYGGAANVAKFAALFGLEVTFATCMSESSEKAFIKNNDLKLINFNNKIENIKTRFYVNHGNATYKHLQINEINKKSFYFDLPADFMSEYDIIALSDYRCGVVSQQLVSNSVKSAALTFGASQISTHPSNFEMFQQMDYLVCNKAEATSFERRENVLITDGANGCMFNEKHYPAPAVKNPANIIGAGDCFYAAILAFGDPLLANQKAAAYVSGDLKC
tara:strand:+ start:1174 stop:1944 length:771 start_codon:yes stop_codon:yes gene_type:complete